MGVMFLHIHPRILMVVIVASLRLKYEQIQFFISLYRTDHVVQMLNNILVVQSSCCHKQLELTHVGDKVQEGISA